MGRGGPESLRALPRVFLPGVDPVGPIELPQEEIDMLRKVLRLSPGAVIAILPDDGTLIRCEFQNKMAQPLEVHHPDTEPPIRLTLAQALPKGDKIDEIVRACTEIGVSRFILFPSDRTVVRWDEKKTTSRVRRLEAIAREAAEVSYRTRLPRIEMAESLEDVLRREPEAVVLSESESAQRRLSKFDSWFQGPESRGSKLLNPQSTIHNPTVIVGPEGGWSAKELALIGDRGATLGPRVLRVDHAGPAAAAILLLEHESERQPGPTIRVEA